MQDMRDVDAANANDPSSDARPADPGMPRRPEAQHSMRSLIVTIIVIVALAFGIRLFIAAPYLVEGSSMEETFHSNDYLMVDRISYDLSAPRRGDVVVLKFPLDTSRTFIKRIIGLPGDTVIMRGQTVEIRDADHPEGFVLDEPYVSPSHETDTNMTVTLEAGQYFVLGDNRKESADSRYWGILPADDIIGKPVLRLFPFTQLGIYPGQARYSTSDTATSTSAS